MKETSNQKRQAENEVVFRSSNQHASENMRVEEATWRKHTKKPTALYFYCECANEHCKLRIKVTPRTYQKLHKNSDQFILIPGHNDPSIERIIKETKQYVIVEKYMTPPKNATKLRKTN